MFKFQKWCPLVRSLSSPRSNLVAESSKFHPSLSFSPNITRPPLLFSSTPDCPNPQQIVPSSRSISNPNFPIPKTRSRSTCFRCGMRGHFAGKCKLPPRCFLCGSTKHKSSRCRDIANMKQEQSSINLSTKGCEDDSWRLIPLRGEYQEPLDCFLSDPDVETCYDARVPQVQAPGPLVQQATGGVSVFERRDVLTQGSLRFRVLKSFPGSYRSGRILSQKSRNGFFRNSRPSLGDFLGKGCKTVASSFPIAIHPQVNANRRKSLDSLKEAFPELGKSYLVVGSENELHPALLDDITNSTILDEFEECCSEDKLESSSPRLSNMDHSVDGFIAKKKGVSSKKKQGAVTLSSVRRSPRLASK